MQVWGSGKIVIGMETVPLDYSSRHSLVNDIIRCVSERRYALHFLP